MQLFDVGVIFIICRAIFPDCGVAYSPCLICIALYSYSTPVDTSRCLVAPTLLYVYDCTYYVAIIIIIMRLLKISDHFYLIINVIFIIIE